MKNKTVIGLIGIFLAFALISNVLAIDGYCFLTLHNGEGTSDGLYSCHHTACQVCSVSATKAYATWNKCGSACQQDPSVQSNLTLTTKWPFADGGTYTKQNFYIDVTTNQIASITFIDNVAGTQKSLCPSCKSYRKSTTFKEGFNDITIRAVVGNQIIEKRITFFIDNKKPVISKTLPLPNKYASGVFTVFYHEANLKEIKLKYGNSLTGMNEKILENCNSGRNQNCSIDINLKSYDNQQIVYWFEIKDIVNNLVIGKQVKINVDETNPEILSFSYPLGKGYIGFNMTISERNFYRIEYMDNSEIIPRWKIICSSLRNGNCFKKIYFRAGERDLDIRVSDKAGNYAFEEAEFTI